MSLGTCPTCDKLSTKLGKWVDSKFCVAHLSPKDKGELARALSQETDFQGSILENDLTMRLKFHPGSNFRGSLIVGLNFGLADLNQANFSFCNFVCCDLRRIRLFNASLRWAMFHCCLVRQADLSNSDCRWMQANAGDISVEQFLSELNHIRDNEPGSYKDYIDIDELVHYPSLYGITIQDEDTDSLHKLFLKRACGDLISAIKEACQYRCRVSERFYDPCHLENALEMAESSSDWSGTLFRSADLAHADFTGAIAVEVCFDSGDLHETNFQCANLSRSSFLHASFSRTRPNLSPHSYRFYYAIMQGCILDGTNISNLFFYKTDLAYALLRNSHIDNTIFLECRLQNADIDSAVANRVHFLLSDLSGANLAGIVANNSHLSVLDVKAFQNSQLESFINSIYGTHYTATNTTRLTGANLRAAELRHANMMQVNLNGALLQGASLYASNLSESICLGAQFAAADLGSTNFDFADLTSCDLSSAGCDSGTSFRLATLKDTNLSGVDLSEISFELTNLNGANLTDCRLDGAKFLGKPEKPLDFSRSDLRNTSLNHLIFENVNLNRSDLSYSRGDHIRLLSCTLDVANLSGVHLDNLEVNQSSFKNSSLDYSYINNGTMTKCNFENTSFKDSIMQGCQILDPSNISGADLTGATFVPFCHPGMPDRPCSLEASELFVAKAVYFNDSDISGAVFRNILFIASQFNSTSMRRVKIDNVRFANCTFDSSNISKCLLLGSHIIFGSFNNSALSFQFNKDQERCIFLGVSFNDCKLPRDESDETNTSKGRFVFLECEFEKSSFMTELNEWEYYPLINCMFKNMNYGALNIEKASNKDSFIAGFIDRNINNYMNDAHLIYETAKGAASDVANERVEAAIGQNNNDNGQIIFKIKKQLCRSLRKDVIDQGRNDLASSLYIHEMRQDLISSNLKYGWSRIFFNHRLSSWLVNAGFCIISIIVALAMNKLYAGFVCLLALLFFPLIFPNAKNTYYNFLTKHIYLYGESFVKILWSSILCILCFSLFFMSFIDNGIERKTPSFYDTSVASNINIIQNDSHAFRASAHFQARIYEYAKQKMEILTTTSLITLLRDLFANAAPASQYSGLIKDGKRLTSEDVTESFLNCIYFSAVTFTTLGYGDIVPVGICRILAMFEAGIGAFFMALLVFAFVRQNALR